MMRGTTHSSGRSQDASWRSATEFVGALIVGGERITIRAGRAALDLPPIVVGISGAILPRPVVGHRAFDGKETLVEIGNDQEERLGGSLSDMRCYFEHYHGGGF
jgi:hypothetical protein